MVSARKHLPLTCGSSFAKLKIEVKRKMMVSQMLLKMLKKTVAKLNSENYQ